MVEFFKRINWKLLENFSLTDLSFFREPVVWMALLASIVKAVSDAAGAGADVWTIAVVVINLVLGFFARAQVTAPLPPKSLRGEAYEDGH